jgi:small subunit ribosomal protein S16
MVTIRLARHGAKKSPAYRVVATDARDKRDGRHIEVVGSYVPSGTNRGIKLDMERVDFWRGKGAIPSTTVARLIREFQKAATAEQT